MEGTPFGQYRLLEQIGRGGMGVVWRAYDSINDRIVAIKVLPADLASDDEFVQRFRREAQAAARLNSPHVIPIHTHGEVDGRLFVDMRLIEGRDLQSVLADGPLESGRAVRIIEQVAKALNAAHKVGLVHRDVKPSNILLDEDDFAYLIDFGIARTADETRLTKTGNVLGSLHYMAPEQFSTPGAIDARADIYSLSCVLYECLTGKRPFPGDNLGQLVAGHLNAAPPQPSNIRPDVPWQLDAVVAKGMAKSPDERFASTVELARAAGDAITGPASRPRTGPPPTTGGTAAGSDAATTKVFAPQRVFAPEPKARPWWRRRAVLIPAAALVVVVAVVVAVTVFAGDRAPRGTTLPFTGLQEPSGVAVDNKGTVYVADGGTNQVVALKAGAAGQTVVPFLNLQRPSDVAVDSKGTVFVADWADNRVIALPDGAWIQKVVPFTDLFSPTGLAVGPDDTLYVADSVNNRVVALKAGSTAQTVLPFTDLYRPSDVAVGRDGAVYVADETHSGVLALPAGATRQTELPFADLPINKSITVNGDGTVYAGSAELNRVVALAPNSTTQTELPFYVDNPSGLAVDSEGTVYVAEFKNTVVKLAAG